MRVTSTNGKDQEVLDFIQLKIVAISTAF